MCGRRPRCKKNLTFGLRSGASHVSGLFARHPCFVVRGLCTGRFAKSLASLSERAHGLRTVDLLHEQELRAEARLRRGNPSLRYLCSPLIVFPAMARPPHSMGDVRDPLPACEMVLDIIRDFFTHGR